MRRQTQTPLPKLGRRAGLRDVLICVAVTALLLTLVKGADLRDAGEELDSGWQRTLVLSVGHPAGWVADKLPFADASEAATSFISPDDDLASSDGEGFASASGGDSAASKGPSPVTTESFDPTELGEDVQKLRLERLLVTGDSLSQPLDAEIAREVAGDGVKTDRSPQLGTAISKTELLDWGKLSREQAGKEPDAVVMFLGANEGFAMKTPQGKSVDCCGPVWATIYANRARQMMDTYRRRGDARVYWLTVPRPRDRDRQDIARAVNLALEKAAAPYGVHVRLISTDAIFAPDDEYTDAIEVDGRKQIVRESDGIHLNARGARLLADELKERLERDFVLGD